jgi:hypothetical protein
MDEGKGAEAGQALVLAVLVLALMVVVALGVAALGAALALRARVQSAADAAALACATQGEWTRWVDARGQVYRVRVAVRPRSGARAAVAAWDANLARVGVHTAALQTSVAGSTCRVVAAIRLRLPALRVLGRGQGVLRWSVVAEARAYPPNAAATDALRGTGGDAG